MTRGILIIGNESSLFSAAAAEALKRVESFASALIPNRFPLPEGKTAAAQTTSGAIPLTWNPSSSISARSLVVAAENRLKQINDAILVCSPPAIYKSAEALSPEEIEILVSDHIKGWFFLVRELLLYFRRRDSGCLSLVVPEIAVGREAGRKGAVGSRSISADIAGPSAAASFRAFAQSVVASHVGEPFRVMGFSTDEAGSEGEFAAWFFKMIDEGAVKNSGRWHKHSRLKLFR